MFYCFEETWKPQKLSLKTHLIEAWLTVSEVQSSIVVEGIKTAFTHDAGEVVKNSISRSTGSRERNTQGLV